jgi:hypothetical protein
VKIAVFTSIIMIDKVLKNCSSIILHNCFKKRKFADEHHMVIRVSIFSGIYPLNIEWEPLPTYGDFIFGDFVLMDDEIAARGALTDAELMTFQDEAEKDNEAETPTPVTSSKATLPIYTLNSYTFRTETNDNFFTNLITIENELDNVRWKSLHQQKNQTTFQNYFFPHNVSTYSY